MLLVKNSASFKAVLKSITQLSGDAVRVWLIELAGLLNCSSVAVLLFREICMPEKSFCKSIECLLKLFGYINVLLFSLSLDFDNCTFPVSSLLFFLIDNFGTTNCELGDCCFLRNSVLLFELDFCKWCAVKAAKEPKECAFILFCEGEFFISKLVDSVWWEISPVNDEKLLGECFVSLSIGFEWDMMVELESLSKKLGSFLKESLGIVNIDIFGLSIETPYLTDEVQYSTWNMKKKTTKKHEVI